MKFAIALLALPLAATTTAFTASSITSSSRPFGCRRHHHVDDSTSSTTTRLDMVSVVTGFKGKPAATAEEDLMLTLRIIMDHELRSTTTSKEQYISQMTEEKIPDTAEPVDVSVPYDAAAQLAYNASDKKMTFEDFKQKYLADAVADVIAKRQPKPVVAATPAVAAAAIDVSIPYDAAAQLAYNVSDKKMTFEDFKQKYLADAVADVIAKRQPKPVVAATPTVAATIDVSVPYDAAAQLAYNASDKKMDYVAFKTKFEVDAVADVISKRRPV